jgi:hypothetical protein
LDLIFNKNNCEENINTSGSFYVIEPRVYKHKRKNADNFGSEKKQSWKWQHKTPHTHRHPVKNRKLITHHSPHSHSTAHSHQTAASITKKNSQSRNSAEICNTPKIALHIQEVILEYCTAL